MTSMLKADIHIENGDWNESHKEIITAVLQTAAKIIAPTMENAELSVLLCDDETIAEINHKWRKKDKATNVLSFPQNDDIEMIGKPNCLGDIILAFGTIMQEATDKGIKISNHIEHLSVHGFLHLFGYDHEKDDEAEIMEAMEQKILKEHYEHSQ